MRQQDTVLLDNLTARRHSSEGIKTSSREMLLALADRHIELAKIKRPDESPNYLEVDTAPYLDAALFEREMQAIWDRYPHVAGLSKDLPQPGSYLRIDDFKTPMFLTRTKSGQLKAFVNGCRHRGTAIVNEERGSGKALFTCPYHGWSYDPNGALVGIPCGSAFEGLDKKEFGLIEIECEERHGMIFVAPRVGQKLELDRHFDSALSDELSGWGFGDVEPIRIGPMVLDVNWKLVLDTFLESYHFGAAHKDNLGIYYNANVNTADVYGKNMRYTIALKTISTEFAALPLEERVPENYISVAYILFPGMVLVTTPQILQMFRIFPQSVNKTVVQFATYSRLPLDAENKALMETIWQNAVDIIMAEDFAFGALTAQRTIASGALKKIVFGRNEKLLQVAKQSIEDALKEVN